MTKLTRRKIADLRAGDRILITQDGTKSTTVIHCGGWYAARVRTGVTTATVEGVDEAAWNRARQPYAWVVRTDVGVVRNLASNATFWAEQRAEGTRTVGCRTASCAAAVTVPAGSAGDEQLRAAGWRVFSGKTIGGANLGDARCPRCSRPDAKVTDLVATTAWGGRNG